jgi:hypothetical protein
MKGLVLSNEIAFLMSRKCASAVSAEKRAAPQCQTVNKSVSDSGDQTIGKSGLPIPGARSRNHLFDVEFLAKAGIEGTQPLCEVGAQFTKVVNIRTQLTADTFLIDVR